MIRANNIICGTSSTGTGTLTLAAGPAAHLTGVDFDVWARSEMGFGNAAAFTCRYAVFSCADATFNIGTATGVEYGVGTITLGASAGIANVTLARSYPLEVATSMASPPATVVLGSLAAPVASASMLNVGAYAVVMLAIDAGDAVAPIPACGTLGGPAGISPSNVVNGAGGTITPVSGTIYYSPVRIECSDLIQTVTLGQYTGLSSPTTQSVAAALYQIGANGLPGKMLINFGTNSAPGVLTNWAPFSITAVAPVPIKAGWYYLAVLPIWTGGTGSPQLLGDSVTAGCNPLGSTNGGRSGTAQYATLASQNALADPAAAPTATSTSQLIIRAMFRNS